ncbi:MAG: rRNA adenine N-6-methyltransferase family protein [Thermotaleaceae bacterium]
MNYEQRLFLKNFIQQPSIVGSIIPSSKYLCFSMLKHINFESSKCIVEYGAGTGIFTKEIIRRKNKDTLFISFELNKDMFSNLKKLHSPNENIYIINDSAENMMNYLNEQGCAEVDYIISGLPFTVLPREVSENILNNTFQVLSHEGSFITFQYSLHFFKTFKEIFPKVQLGLQLLNLPPAFIYYCNKVETQTYEYG